MKNRVQIWMSREDFKALQSWCDSKEAADLTDEGGGPLLALAIAVEGAHSNNANYDEHDEDHAPYRALAPPCRALVPNEGQNACTLQLGHDGEHRCKASDVDARSRRL